MPYIINNSFLSPNFCKMIICGIQLGISFAFHEISFWHIAWSIWNSFSTWYSSIFRTLCNMFVMIPFLNINAFKNPVLATNYSMLIACMGIIIKTMIIIIIIIAILRKMNWNKMIENKRMYFVFFILRVILHLCFTETGSIFTDSKCL